MGGGGDTDNGGGMSEECMGVWVRGKGCVGDVDDGGRHEECVVDRVPHGYGTGHISCVPAGGWQVGGVSVRGMQPGRVQRVLAGRRQAEGVGTWGVVGTHGTHPHARHCLSLDTFHESPACHVCESVFIHDSIALSVLRFLLQECLVVIKDFKKIHVNLGSWKCKPLGFVKSKVVRET